MLPSGRPVAPSSPTTPTQSSDPRPRVFCKVCITASDVFVALSSVACFSLMAAWNEKNQNQRWTLSPKGQLKHQGSLLCLDSGEGNAGQDVTVAVCEEAKPSQVWEFDFYDAGKEDWRPSKP